MDRDKKHERRPHHPPRPPRPPKPPRPPVSPPSPSSPPAPHGSNERDGYLKCLQAQVGKRYVWATAGPNTFDCSGLVNFCYRQATGREIPGGRGSQEQMRSAGRKLSPGDKIQAGDLLFYLGGEHVNSAISATQAIGAINEGLGVRQVDSNNSYWKGVFTLARRLWD